MEYIERPADKAFKGQVKSCFYFNHSIDQNNHILEIYPDTYYKLIFNYSQTDIFYNGEVLPPVFLIPIINKTSILTYQSHIKIIGIRLKSNCIKNNYQLQRVIKVDCYKEIFNRLKESLEENNTNGALNLVTSFFNAFIRDFIKCDRQNFLDDFYASKTIKELAGKYQKSIRQIERIYKKNIGISPKLFFNVSRFEKVKEQIWINPDCSLTELAYKFEFTDQSHLIKEFKKITNLTPKQFSNQVKTIKSQFGLS